MTNEPQDPETPHPVRRKGPGRLDHLRPWTALRIRRRDASTVPALLAGLAIGAPLVLLLALGRSDLFAFAAFGGFTSLYGRNEPYAVRMPLLAAAGTTMTLAVAVGALTAAHTDEPWVAVLVVALLAGLVKLLTDAVRTGPPGGLMPAFAVAVCAEMPLGPSDVPLAVGVAAAVATWSWLLCNAGRVTRPHGPEKIAVARALETVGARLRAATTDAEPALRHVAAQQLQRAWQTVQTASASPERRSRLEALCVHAESGMREARLAAASGEPAAPGRAAQLGHLARLLRRPGPVPVVPRIDEAEAEQLAGVAAGPAAGAPVTAVSRRPASRWGAGLRDLSLGSPLLPLALRVTAGAALAGGLAHLIGLGHAPWASVSAVAVLQSVNASSTADRAVQRGVGTAAGVVLGVLSLTFVPSTGWLVALVIGLQVMAELVVAMNYALGLVFATPVALLLADVGGDVAPAGLVTDRVLDTLVGLGVAVAVALLVPNDRLAADLRARLDAVQRRTRSAATALAGPRGVPDREAVARELASALFALREAYDAAAGEPWPEDLPAEDVLRAERDGHRLLARLTR